jgi:Tol biopolymer transport system component/PKD repeat protein
MAKIFYFAVLIAFLNGAISFPINAANPHRQVGQNSQVPQVGQIAFSQKQNGNFDIFVINSDGTGLKNLTNSPLNEYSPEWSPDGQQIAFISDETGKKQVYLMSADGTGKKALLSVPGEVQSFAWSHDGKYLLLNNFIDLKDKYQYGVFILDLMDEKITTLLNLPPNVRADGSWSPDNQKLAFEMETSFPGQEAPVRSCVVVINIDGSNLQKIGDWVDRSNLLGCKYIAMSIPNWSPDGQWITYTSISSGFDLQGFSKDGVYISKPDGTGITNLTKISQTGRNETLSANQPTWSSDGKYIYVWGDFDETITQQLYQIEISNSKTKRLTTILENGYGCSELSWSSNQTEFVTFCPSVNAFQYFFVIYSIDRNQRNILAIYNPGDFLGGYSWRPIAVSTSDVSSAAPNENGACNNPYWPIFSGATWSFETKSTELGFDYGNGTVVPDKVTTGVSTWTVSTINTKNPNRIEFTIAITDNGGKSSNQAYYCDKTGIYDSTDNHQVLPSFEKMKDKYEWYSNDKPVRYHLYLIHDGQTSVPAGKFDAFTASGAFEATDSYTSIQYGSNVGPISYGGGTVGFDFSATLSSYNLQPKSKTPSESVDDTGACKNPYWPIFLGAEWVYDTTNTESWLNSGNGTSGQDKITNGTLTKTITNINTKDPNRIEFTIQDFKDDGSKFTELFYCNKTGIFDASNDSLVLPSKDNIKDGFNVPFIPQPGRYFQSLKHIGVVHTPAGDFDTYAATGGFSTIRPYSDQYGLNVGPITLWEGRGVDSFSAILKSYNLQGPALHLPNATSTEISPIQPNDIGVCNNPFWPIFEGASWTFQTSLEDKLVSMTWMVTSINKIDSSTAEFIITITSPYTISSSWPIKVTSEPMTRIAHYRCDTSGIYANDFGSKDIFLPSQNELITGKEWPPSVLPLVFNGMKFINVPKGNFEVAEFFKGNEQVYQKYHFAKNVGIIDSEGGPKGAVVRWEMTDFHIPSPGEAPNLPLLPSNNISVDDWKKCSNPESVALTPEEQVNCGFHSYQMVLDYIHVFSTGGTCSFYKGYVGQEMYDTKGTIVTPASYLFEFYNDHLKLVDKKGISPLNEPCNKKDENGDREMYKQSANTYSCSWQDSNDPTSNEKDTWKISFTKSGFIWELAQEGSSFKESNGLCGRITANLIKEPNSSQTLIQDPELILFQPIIQNDIVVINGVAVSKTDSIAKIKWDWGDGTSNTGWFPNKHTYSSPGIYMIKVTAVDLTGKENSAMAKIFIDNINNKPSCSPAVTLMQPEITGGEVKINGVAISECSAIQKIIWDWGDGGVNESYFPAPHRYTSPGLYTITTTAIDEYGNQSSASTSVDIKQGSQPIQIPVTESCVLPKISIGNIQNKDGMVTIDGSATASCGAVQQYIWEWGDNVKTVGGFPASHSYSNPGNLIIHLTAIDNLGNTTLTDIPITVDKPTSTSISQNPTTANGATLEVWVYLDKNKNNEFDRGEDWVQGIQVSILGEQGNLICQGLTGGGGSFDCPNLPLGKNYYATINPPRGYSSVPASRPGISVEDKTTYATSYGLQSSSDSRISGVVWVDKNLNGQFDNADGLPDPNANFQIGLQRKDGIGGPQHTRVDPATGYYSFDGLAVGIDYFVTLEIPSNYTEVLNKQIETHLGSTPVTINFLVTDLIQKLQPSQNTLLPSISANPNPGYIGQSITFDGSGSQATGKPIQKFHLDFGDGTLADSTKTTHQFTNPGTYPVVLTITNSAGESKIARMNLVIIQDPKTLPVTFQTNPDPVLDKFYKEFYDTNFSDPDNVLIAGEMSRSKWYLNQSNDLRSSSNLFKSFASTGESLSMVNNWSGYLTSEKITDYICTSLALQGDLSKSEVTQFGNGMCEIMTLGGRVVSLFSLNPVEIAQSFIENLNDLIFMSIDADKEFYSLKANEISAQSCAAEYIGKFSGTAEKHSLTHEEARELLTALIVWESSRAREQTLESIYYGEMSSGVDAGKILMSLKGPFIDCKTKEKVNYSTWVKDEAKCSEEYAVYLNKLAAKLSNAYFNIFGTEPFNLNCSGQ